MNRNTRFFFAIFGIGIYQPIPDYPSFSSINQQNDVTLFSTCMQLGQYARSPHTQNSWRQFTLQLHQNSPKTNIKLVAMTKKLSQLRVINYWLDNFFLPAWQKYNSEPKQIALILLKKDDLERDFLEEIFFKQQRLNLIKKDNWQLAPQANHQWYMLKEQIIPFFLTSYISKGEKAKGTKRAIYSFTRSFANMSQLSRLAALTTMQTLVSVLDQSVEYATISYKPAIEKERIKLLSHWKNLAPLNKRKNLSLQSAPNIIAKEYELDGYI